VIVEAGYHCKFAKKNLQLHPALATLWCMEEIITVQKIDINEKFHLINIIF